MNKYIVLSALTLVLVGAVATSVFAYQGDPTKKGPNYTPEREAAITKAIENGDYVAWKNAMIPGAGVTKRITQETFPKFAQMWKLEHAGKTVEASILRKELGLGQGGGIRNGTGTHMGRGQGMHRGVK